MLYKSGVQHLYNVERKRIYSPDNVVMRLQRLEKPENWSEGLLGVLWGMVPDELLQQYPDYPPFYQKLADFVGVRSDQLVVGAGIEDFLRNLFWLCCDPGDAAVMLWPSCALFDIYAEIFKVNLIKIKTDPVEPLTMSDVVSGTPSWAKVLFLPNPGQPVETHFSEQELRVIARHCRENNIVFVVDEAYFCFGGTNALPLVKDYDNVLVLRTFSKAFGAASIRVGYAVGSPRVLKPLEAFRMSGEITGPSVYAASKIMDFYDLYVVPSIAAVCDGRDWLRTELEHAGFWCQGSVANHVLIDVGTDEVANAVQRGLANQGIYIKHGFPPPVDHHLMVTCGSRELMERFLSAFLEVWDEARFGLHI